MANGTSKSRSALSLTVWSALLVAGVVTAPATSAPTAPFAPASPRVLQFLGSRAAEILAGSDRVEVFRLRTKRAGEDEKSVGGYAIAPTWGDGHHTGYYTFRMLRDRCPCETCTAGRNAAMPTGTVPAVERHEEHA